MKSKPQAAMKVSDDHTHDLRFFWSLFRTPHLGIVITDLLGTLVKTNETAGVKIFEGNKPDNLFELFTCERENDLVALKLGHLISDHMVFIMILNGKKYKVYGIKQPAPLLYMWMINPEPIQEPLMQIESLDIYYKFVRDNTFEMLFQSGLNGKIVFSNKLFKSTFGYDDEALNLLLLRDIFLQSNLYDVAIEKLGATGYCDDSIVHFKTKDGGLVIGKLNARMDTDESGNAVITWTVLNVTQNHEYELSLMQKNEDLAKVNAQMEKFLYSTSHDLRSPLTSILGLVNLIRIERPNNPVMHYVDKVESCVNKLDGIIKDLMHFSKNSYQRLQSEKVFLEIQIWKIIKSLSTLPNYRRISFDVLVEENETFYSDTERLEIILTNIIRNAIIFSDANKSKPFVTIKAQAVFNGAVIQIMDNGIGIGHTHHDQVFNMFYRATERSQGAGLGLYVVKEAVERLKGVITVESEIGFGSMFKVTIPNDPKGKLVSKKLRLQGGQI